MVMEKMQWSCPEIYNAFRELSRIISSGTSEVHINAMKRVMDDYLGTREKGWYWKQTIVWMVTLNLNCLC